MAIRPAYLVVLRLSLVAATVAAFAWYLSYHGELLRQLVSTPPNVIVILFLIYWVWFAALALTVHATLHLCRSTLPVGEHVLLNAYSTLVNFFVPGQGGLAIRGLYLKRRHGLTMRTYVYASLVYYACYAVVSVVLLLSSSTPWWQTLGASAVVALLSLLTLRSFFRRAGLPASPFRSTVAKATCLMTATVLQAAVQALVYGYELRTIDPGVRWSQVISYTGAANFSLFVAVTPGAIGIRESFLVFSERLHHISTATIVAASLIDRSVFMLLLASLASLAFVFHAQRIFRSR